MPNLGQCDPTRCELSVPVPRREEREYCRGSKATVPHWVAIDVRSDSHDGRTCDHRNRTPKPHGGHRLRGEFVVSSSRVSGTKCRLAGDPVQCR